jgi:hypothetical protein
MMSLEKNKLLNDNPWLKEFYSRFGDNEKLDTSVSLPEFYANLVKKYFKTTQHEYDLTKIVVSIFCLNNERSFSKRQIFRRIQIRHTDLSFDLFEEFFQVFSKFFLSQYEENVSQSTLSLFNTNRNTSGSTLLLKKYVVFHSTFRQWLSNSYYCSFDETLEILTLYHWSKLCSFKTSSMLSRTSTAFYNINSLELDFIDEESSKDEMIRLKAHVEYLRHLNNFYFYKLKCKSQSVNKSIEKIFGDHLDFLDLNNSERLYFFKIIEEKSCTDSFSMPTTSSLINSASKSSSITLKSLQIVHSKTKYRFLNNFRQCLLSCCCLK